MISLRPGWLQAAALGWMAAALLLMMAKAAPAGEALKVTDFGAVPNDGKDDAPAFQAALEACAKKPGATLALAPGTYDLFGGKKDAQGVPHGPSVVAKGLRGVTIDGGGAELVGHDLAEMFRFDGDSADLVIRNLQFDWDPLPFTGGKVVARGEKSFDLEAVAPHVARAGVLIQGVLGFDPQEGRMARRGLDHYQREGECRTPTELVSPGVMRVFVSQPGAVPPLGANVIARHQIYGMNVFTVIGCDNVRLENVTVYACPGMGLYADSCKDFTLRNFRVEVKPGSGRWMTTEADATHFNNCRGRITFEDCLFERMGDDATNFHLMYSVVRERVDERTVRLVMGRGGGGWPAMPRQGDVLEFGGGENPLVPYAAVTVAAVERDAPGKAAVVHFTEALPAQVAKGHVVANTSTAPSVRIQRCTVRQNRARGMLVQTRDVVIEDCDFEDISGAALHICSDANYWWEGLGTRNVTIRGSRFSRCNFGAARRAGVIDLFAEVGPRLAGPGVHRGIVIENNTIADADGAAIHVGCADGVVLRGNTILRPQG
ncbi:MAG: right-handed parallel beta-helix repeat-containing protein, partial [Planctomycetota bacterium]|nr:right-handed parallel beta-helix repeat-containing protein [Planctomycetota bacterium]